MCINQSKKIKDYISSILAQISCLYLDFQRQIIMLDQVYPSSLQIQFSPKNIICITGSTICSTKIDLCTLISFDGYLYYDSFLDT